MPDCIELKPLEVIDENRMILYYLHHTPWPVRNRDAVLQVTTNLDTVKKALFIHSVLVDDERYPPTDNPVRMEAMEAHWTIQYIDDTHTEIIYQLSSDPGGLIPEGQIRRTTEDLPTETLIGLSKMIAQTEYIEKAKSSPERKIVDQF